MKTKEILDKYKVIVAALLNCKVKDIKFYLEQVIDDTLPTKRFEFVEIGEMYYVKPGENGCEDWQREASWQIGKYKVTCKGQSVSSWRLYQMPHCCAFMVSCNVDVAKSFQHKRVGTILNQLRQDIGRILGYSACLCTDVEQNTNQRKLLATNGWKDIFDVVNKRTQNRVFLSVINL